MTSTAQDAAPARAAPARGAFPTTRDDLAHAPRRLWEDGKLVFGSGRNWLLLLGATAYSFAAESFEDNEAVFFRNHTIYSDFMQQALGALGNGATLLGGAVAWYYLAKGQESHESYEASKTVLSAMTLTTIATVALKATVQDSRPSGGSQDFPSGHTSVSMSVAASLDELYGHGVGFPAYGLSFLIGLQRLDIGKHDTGSVVFGWVLGYIVGQTVASHHAPRLFGMEVGVELDEDMGAPAVRLSKSL